MIQDHPHPTYPATNRKKEKPRFKDYTGTNLWRVENPDHGQLEVFAPSKPAAIATAAGVWARRWQEYDFYAYCDVTFCGNERVKK